MRGIGFMAKINRGFFLNGVETGSEAHPLSYTMGTKCSISRGKAAGT
jgi:hypothetical protein